MAFNKPTVSAVQPDIKNLSIYLRSVKKWGKSTLFRDVIMCKYGDPEAGVLVEVGMERGDKLLGANTTHLDTYKDLIEFKKWLISEKGKEHNIQIVGFDTADELMPIFETEVIRRYNMGNPQKQLKSIKAVYGGYNSGVEMAAEMVKKYMDEIKTAGFGVWVIAHTKFKNIKEKGNVDDEGYMQLTSNLVNSYESAFGDIFDATLTGVIDRAIEKKKGVDGKEKNYSTDSVRKLYFRGTTLIDAGGRFASDTVPEYMEFDKTSIEMANEFVKVVEEGMKQSVPTGVTIPKSKPVPANDISAETDDPVDTFDETAVDPVEDDVQDNNTDKDSLIADIREKFKTADKELKAAVKKVLTEQGSGKLDDSLPTEILLEIQGMF